MPDLARAQAEQTVIDDALSAAALLGFLAPPVAIVAKVAKVAVDVGFAAYFASLRQKADQAQAARVAGQAAATSSAVTSALMHERNEPVICGQQLVGHMGRAYHGADCAAHAGCGKEIERS